MSYKIMYVLNALVALVFGIGFLFFPKLALVQFGFAGRIPEMLLAQFFGTAMLTIGLLLWFAKELVDAGVQKGMGIALLVGSIVGLIVSVIGVAKGMLQTNGWVAIVIYAFFALGYAFMLFLKPKMKE